jgi:hypothetical protein
MTEKNIRELASAVMLQAVKDYFATTYDSSRKAILKDLRSPWMDMLSGGLSIAVAEQLEKEPEKIKKRLRYSRS